MLNLRIVCTTVCFACIAAGVVLGLFAIWGGIDEAVALKGVLSVLLVFVASYGVPYVNDIMHPVTNKNWED